MANTINSHNRIDFRNHHGIKGEWSERQYSHHPAHSRSIFHAYTSLFTQEADGGNDSEDERYLAKYRRNYEGYRKVSNKAHNSAVHNIWSD